MSVEDYVLQKLKNGAIHMTLIDPASQEPAQAGKIAKDACSLGTDAIMIGGSTGVTQENLDQTALEIKKNSNVPSIYFPSGASAMSPPLRCHLFYEYAQLPQSGMGDQRTGGRRPRGEKNRSGASFYGLHHCGTGYESRRSRTS